MPNKVTENVLDLTVPAEHRDSVRYVHSVAANTPDVQVDNATITPEVIMPVPATATPAATETPVDVKAIATAAAQELLKERDNQLAVAAKIESLLTDKNSAEARANKAETDLANATKTITTLTADVENHKAEAAKQKKAADDKGQENDDLKNKFKKAKADLDAINITKTVASRTEALDKAGLKSQARLDKAIAHNKDTGEFTLTDEQFNAYVAELTEVLAAGKASAAPAPAAPAAPAEGTPAPAVAAAGTPAPVLPVVPVQGSAAVIPAAPDLSTADIQAQAVAAVLSGQGSTPTANGVNQMANAFGTI